MADHPNPHLKEPQLLRCVIDDTELPLDQQEHLAQCLVCQGERERLQNQLAALGKMAERLAPSPGPPLRLASLQGRGQHDRPRLWLGLLKWTTVAATAAMMTMGPWFLHQFQKDQVAAVKREMRQDERLLLTVNRLERNALPSFYLEITGEDEADDAGPSGDGHAASKPEHRSSFGSSRRLMLYVETIVRRDARC